MNIPEEAVQKAHSLGADAAGFVPARKLAGCPSEIADGPPGFSAEKGSFLVLGLYHDPEKPWMDFWNESSSTPGDQMLHRMTKEISKWLLENHGIKAHDIPYQIYDGGIYLKDAAVLAGLGRIGNNNLVLVPGFGPRIRFRALWADMDVPEPDLNEEPLFCEKCPNICQKQCPMKAFPEERYSRPKCMQRMDLDKAMAEEFPKVRGADVQVKHCRICELVCPSDR